MSLSCADCQLPYGEPDWPCDLNITNDLWAKIAPAEDQCSNLLCPNCMCKRLWAIGVYCDIPAGINGAPTIITLSDSLRELIDRVEGGASSSAKAGMSRADRDRVCFLRELGLITRPRKRSGHTVPWWEPMNALIASGKTEAEVARAILAEFPDANVGTLAAYIRRASRPPSPTPPAAGDHTP